MRSPTSAFLSIHWMRLKISDPFHNTKTPTELKQSPMRSCPLAQTKRRITLNLTEDDIARLENLRMALQRNYMTIIRKALEIYHTAVLPEPPK